MWHFGGEEFAVVQTEAGSSGSFHPSNICPSLGIHRVFLQLELHKIIKDISHFCLGQLQFSFDILYQQPAKLFHNFCEFKVLKTIQAKKTQKHKVAPENSTSNLKYFSLWARRNKL